MTPLVFYDLIIFLNNLSITTAYLSLWEVLAILLLMLCIVWGLVLLFKKAPVAAVSHQRISLQFIIAFCCLTVSLTIPYSAYHQNYGNIIESYRDYGFTYSLLRSAIDRGVQQPAAYEEEQAVEIFQAVTEDETAISAYKKRPNFVFLQLESFIDPALITTVQCSEDPVPTFSRLKNECSTGLLYVPSIGGGTANVEFEVMSGMRLSDFGTGEYPYTSILRKQTCESLPYALKELGYTAHAIHNHSATFYDRHLVYPNLGFDTFTSLEYMQDYQTNALGWCHDDVLTNCIMDALRSSEGKDLVFTISVQGHGNYPTDAPDVPYAITSSGLEADEKRKNEFEYYINTLHETDAFLSALLDELNAYPEPVVLVVYGDHLPALSFSEEELSTGDHLATEYVLWSNDGRLAKYDRNISAFQLASYVLNRCRINQGLLIRFHQERMYDPDYLSQLALLEYDIIYGEHNSDSGFIPHAPANMTMGIHAITPRSATLHGNLLIVEGDGFTRHSVVCANNSVLNTQYINPNMLIATLTLLANAEADDLISVAQISGDGTVLSESEPVICQLAE